MAEVYIVGHGTMTVLSYEINGSYRGVGQGWASCQKAEFEVVVKTT